MFARLIALVGNPLHLSAVPTQKTQTISSNPCSIHTTVLPILNVNLYEALVAEPPPRKNIVDFIRADAAYVNDIVQAISMLTQNNEIQPASFTGENMIHQVSIIEYIYWTV
jgi:hypothetical protein